MLDQFMSHLRKLEQLPGANDKIALIRAEGEQFKKLYELALSPFITFGVAKYPPTEPLKEFPEPSLTWEVLLDKLSTRELSGNKAITEIARWRRHSLLDEDEAFSRILLKDLRCGVSVKTVNKALPGTIPTFEVQLAPSKLADPSKLSYPVVVEPKYDGVRTVAVKKGGYVFLFSRNGKSFDNFAELNADLRWLPEGVVTDGEVISPNGFQALMTRVKAKPGVHDDVPIRYAVFDCMSLDDFQRQQCGGDQMYRSRRFGELLKDLGVEQHSLSFPAPSYLATSEAHLSRLYEQFVSQGFEGAMLKNPNGLYTFARNATWQKLKPFDTLDLKVVNLIEGTGKYINSLGAIVVEGEVDGKLIRTEVGSGFSDAARQAIWKRGKAVLDDVVEVRFQDITQAQDEKDVFSLRFPSFKGFREDKAA